MGRFRASRKRLDTCYGQGASQQPLVPVELLPWIRRQPCRCLVDESLARRVESSRKCTTCPPPSLSDNHSLKPFHLLNSKSLQHPSRLSISSSSWPTLSRPKATSSSSRSSSRSPCKLRFNYPEPRH